MPYLNNEGKWVKAGASLGIGICSAGVNDDNDINPLKVIPFFIWFNEREPGQKRQSISNVIDIADMDIFHFSTCQQLFKSDLGSTHYFFPKIYRI